jgi:hypothetical protein
LCVVGVEGVLGCCLLGSIAQSKTGETTIIYSREPRRELGIHTGSGIGIQQLRNEASYDVVHLNYGKDHRL